MLRCLSVVWLFLLSSNRFHIVVSYSERRSFHKIRRENLKRGSGLTNDVKIMKIHENVEFRDVWDRENAVGSSGARNV